MLIQGTRSHTFLPLAIQFFMWLWVIFENVRRFFYNLFHGCKKEYLPFQKTYNHWSGISIRLQREWEAIWPKVVEREIQTNHHEVAEWEIKCTIEKEAEVVRFLREQVAKGRKYEIANFWWHIVKVITGKWYGPTGDSQFSCVELVNKVLIILGKEAEIHFNPYETQRLLGTPDYTYHADNVGTFRRIIFWILDRSTYIVFGLIIILVVWLTATGQIFTNLPHWIDNPKW